MSGFHALNIESDDESDIEIDDTKEIQIEEALKLYQNALKYHAEGPPSFVKAEEAYRQLFDSEVFRYPESQAELRRIELYGVPDQDDFLDDLQTGLLPTTTGLDTGPSTLPQILHLSHKNYAQFRLESLSAKFDSFNASLNQILADASEALEHFVQALDKDDSDLDLWRRTASVGEILDSKRIARFCLESVLAEDDAGLNAVMSLPGLEEGFAGEQLRDLVMELQDHLSLLQAPLSVTKRKVLSQMLKRQLHPYRGLLQQKSLAEERGEEAYKAHRYQNVPLKAPATWTELGDQLLKQLQNNQYGMSSSVPGVPIVFELGRAISSTHDSAEHTRSPSTAGALPNAGETAMPTSLSDMFPGLDSGRPTVQPQIASADPSMQVASASPQDMDVDPTASPTMTLPSRKRSGDAAGLNDGPEEGRTKSRRTRTRESNVDSVEGRQAVVDANTRWEYEQQLNEFQAADDWMFETVGNFFERAGIVGFDAARHVRQEMASSTGSTPSTEPTNAMQDLKIARSAIQSFLDRFDDKLAHFLLHGGETLNLGQSHSVAGGAASYTMGSASRAVNKMPLMINDGLQEMLTSVNEGQYLTKEVTWLFIEALFEPGKVCEDGSSYTQYLWPEDLKTIVVRNMVNFDDSIYAEAFSRLDSAKGSLTQESFDAPAEMVQGVFELHLDIYSLIKQPNSGVESDIVIAQGDRLQRWSDLAREYMQFRAERSASTSLQDPLNLRFLWATTAAMGTSSEVTQDHILECMNDLRGIFAETGELSILLQNNAIMPELSLAALDRDISRLTTKDFFLKVTDQDLRDPASVIESLEPLLEALEAARQRPGTDGDTAEPPPGVSSELVRFLEGSNVSTRLLLWQRLRDAYIGIEYKPMVVYCYLRMARIVLDELKSAEVAALPQADRQSTVLKCFRLLQDMVKRMYNVLQSSSDALETIDGDRLNLGVTAFGEILQLLQVFNVAEDSLRVGQSHPPSQPNGLPVPSFGAVTTMVHEMQVQIWIILYAFLQEAMAQNADQFPTPLGDRFDFLRTAHRNLGIRGICGKLNRAFVRMLKDEFFHMQHVDGYDSEQAQVLHDLYRLNCFLNPSYELIEHNCTADAFLDRNVALQAVDLLLAQASKLPVKELIKHPLKDTIDKVHGALARKKPTEAILRNREIYRAYLKSPINPVDLFSCLKGDGNQLPVTPIPRDDALLASKGWHFLMGHLALTKYRSQKRTGPTPTEDVDIAIAFFNQDLEYTGENWETWLRLAQAYDTKIEENVVWSAEKLNNNMQEIISMQRAALHCYIMATALAYRSADLAFETSSKMTELFYDFAHRLYSSAREPFNMHAFEVEDTERFVSLQSAGVQRQVPFKSLRVYTAVKLANVLFKRALPGKPDNWMLHYMIGKCLHKMHAAPSSVRPHGEAPAATQVLAAFVRALELLPDKDKKESRDTKKEPVLEPHYKLLSIVHKLLTLSKSITLQQAKEVLGHSFYARKDEETFPTNMNDWTPYVLGVLKTLRAADKSNWYHRMIFRSAYIIYEDAVARGDEDAGAIGAKQELSAQMFTKTMVLQVWRPESERAGRHFVYTTAYTRFFMKILKHLNDRAGLEQLARRVRRRPHDLFEHGQVWQDICNAYLQLLRSHGALSEGLETSTFSNIVHEDFLARKEPLERWMQSTDNGVSPALDVLREVQELKKINQSLMKPGAIDDLIGDSYAQLFNTVGKQLWEEELRAKREEDAKREAEKPPPVLSPARNPMMSLTHLMNVDGSSDTAHTPQPHAGAAPSATLGPSADAPPVRRKVGVGRREIRTTAESCFQKAGSKTQPIDPDKIIANAPKVQVLIERARLPLLGEASVETSAPGSIHDSADDESELSELEDDNDRPQEDRSSPVDDEGEEMRDVQDDEGVDMLNALQHEVVDATET
ncbi:Histone transcription regulator 3 [Fulvia fulva]|uniref:Histone transcription regulator 3 homolog n=1 Tax=Passalora fulva TaxID=5499 RepID=A0A9Q8URF8_PASFU|nr:Histone transcription regulator 3 [Fulvia fulva]UJO19690.1 Histone transcription regulator 3 [Fulvia fulva]